MVRCAFILATTVAVVLAVVSPAAPDVEQKIVSNVSDPRKCDDFRRRDQ